jgi:hypothetical protein
MGNSAVVGVITNNLFDSVLAPLFFLFGDNTNNGPKTYSSKNVITSASP